MAANCIEWACGAIGFDAVKHLVVCRIERRPPRLDLTIRCNAHWSEGRHSKAPA
jgi:hypothetical protein